MYFDVLIYKDSCSSITIKSVIHHRNCYSTFRWYCNRNSFMPYRFCSTTGVCVETAGDPRWQNIAPQRSHVGIGITVFIYFAHLMINLLWLLVISETGCDGY